MKRFLIFLLITAIIGVTGCTVTINGKEAFKLGSGYDGKPVEKTEMIEEKVDSQIGLKVSNASGRIVIIPWDKDTIKITAVKQLGGFGDKKLESLFEDLKINVDKRSGEFDVSVKYINGLWGFNHQSVDLEISVPEKINDIKAASASGDIKLSNFMDLNKLTLTSVSGNVEASGFSAQSYEIGSTSGDMTISNANGKGDIHSVSGSMDINKIRGAVRLKTTSGDIDAYDFDGSTVFSTVSGDLYLKGPSLKASSFNSTSGDIKIEAASIDNLGEYKFNTVSGGINIYIPENTGFNLEVRTVSGDIRNEFDFTSSENDGGKSKRWVKGSVGSGGAKFDIHTTSGDIIISKK